MTEGDAPMSPHVFRGLWCRCGEQHHQAANYYVSVVDGSRVVLAAGPYPEHDRALAYVEPVRRIVEARYNPGGRAHWYGYGTTAMRPTYAEPGKLNAELQERT